MKYKDLEIQTSKDLRDQDSKRGVWKRITFEADISLWRSLQDESRNAGCSVSELIRAIVTRWIDESEPECKMDESCYQTELCRAAYFMRCDSERNPFWAGYHKGLHRAHDGEAFGTPDEHRALLGLAECDDPLSRMRGEGYLAGLEAVRTGVPFKDNDSTERKD